MSDECRCDDIREYNREKDKLSRIYDYINQNFSYLESITNITHTIADTEAVTYEANNKEAVTGHIRNFTNGMSDRLNDALSAVDAEKSRIYGILSDLNHEDHEYHEAERRRREREAEEERNRENARRAGLLL